MGEPVEQTPEDMQVRADIYRSIMYVWGFLIWLGCVALSVWLIGPETALAWAVVILLNFVVVPFVAGIAAILSVPIVAPIVLKVLDWVNWVKPLAEDEYNLTNRAGEKITLSGDDELKEFIDKEIVGKGKAERVE